MTAARWTGEHWYDRAACRGVSVELFYSDREADIAEAVRICRGCPVRDRCLQVAIEHQEAFGVWGGTPERPRRRVYRRLQRETTAQSDAA
jgi:WhiB family transcriptional regulator, redox-sensing transcriptional regulator